MALLPPHPLRHHQSGTFEYREVLHHTEPGEFWQHLAQLVQPLPVTLVEGVQQRAPTAVGECPEHPLEIHVRHYR